MFTPFEYQEACLEAIETHRQAGFKKALIVMATGLGKTVTMAFDAKLWVQTHKGRFLYLCHQNDILYQAKATFQAVLGSDYTYGYFHGEEKSLHTVDFLFASLQTMETHKEFFERHEFSYIVVDESHHAQAETFRSTIEYFTPDFLLGATATPDRLDELNIREIFGEEIFSLPLEEAMARGYLAPIDYRLLTDEIQLSRVIETEKGRVSIAQLNKKLFIPRRDEEIAQIIGRYVAEIENHRVIGFCNSVKHCDHLAHFVANSFSIHSRIPTKERGVRLEMFRHGIIDTVLTVDCFNEGIDVPEANVIVFLRSTGSDTIFKQQLGRGLRRAEGKTKVVVLDFVGNCERIKMVSELFKKVQEQFLERLEKEGSAQKTTAEPMTLNINSAGFQEKIVPILDLFARMRRDFYPTWQEAGEAAKALGIRSQDEYRRRYKKDARLPSAPEQAYSDFPGYDAFLGRYYSSVEEASSAAQALGIRSSTEYPRKYKRNPKLNSAPDRYYGNFPGWPTFLGTKATVYESWEKAKEAAQALRIPNRRAYPGMRKADPLLPPRPQNTYKDFPGWREFLGTNFYSSWEEASVAAVKLGANSPKSYEEIYKKDPQLPSSPHHVYESFPGWPKFLGKK